jgi:hypothetical protein
MKYANEKKVPSLLKKSHKPTNVDFGIGKDYSSFLA